MKEEMRSRNKTQDQSSMMSISFYLFLYFSEMLSITSLEAPCGHEMPSKWPSGPLSSLCSGSPSLALPLGPALCMWRWPRGKTCAFHSACFFFLVRVWMSLHLEPRPQHERSSPSPFWPPACGTQRASLELLTGSNSFSHIP